MHKSLQLKNLWLLTIIVNTAVHRANALLYNNLFTHVVVAFMIILFKISWLINLNNIIIYQ